ncbi:hypothetical protein LIER_00988 [Lithospermum erythrorhizon]|uniref:Uncharacterized protein n=1 Tax=Lithospermum erythrorhizon TaxID=34254 RepID=A0AAV3NJC5_LITER
MGQLRGGKVTMELRKETQQLWLLGPMPWPPCGGRIHWRCGKPAGGIKPDGHGGVHYGRRGLQRDNRKIGVDIVRGNGITDTSQDEIPHTAWDRWDTGEPGAGTRVLLSLHQVVKGPSRRGGQAPRSGGTRRCPHF